MDNKQLFLARNFLLITFPTTHAALSGEKSLTETEISNLVIPTPREISAGCGLALRIFPADYAEVLNIFQASGIILEDVYNVNKTNGTTLLVKLPE